MLSALIFPPKRAHALIETATQSPQLSSQDVLNNKRAQKGPGCSWDRAPRWCDKRSGHTPRRRSAPTPAEPGQLPLETAAFPPGQRLLQPLALLASAPSTGHQPQTRRRCPQPSPLCSQGPVPCLLRTSDPQPAARFNELRR